MRKKHNLYVNKERIWLRRGEAESASLGVIIEAALLLSRSALAPYDDGPDVRCRCVRARTLSAAAFGATRPRPAMHFNCISDIWSSVQTKDAAPQKKQQWKRQNFLIFCHSPALSKRSNSARAAIAATDATAWRAHQLFERQIRLQNIID